MSANMRRNFSGVFLAQDLGGGAWRLTRSGAHPLDVYLLGAEQGAARAFGEQPIAELGIEWHAASARLSFVANGGAQALHTSSAIVHEPLQHLYENLPLSLFDASARRFWRWVFRLARIPGGRHLLNFLARRT